MNTGIFKFDQRSARNLIGVHPDLVKIVELAAVKSRVKFLVTEGVRSAARQQELMQAGATRTLKSRHIGGFAVDVAAVVGDEIRWDWPLYAHISDAMHAAADELGLMVEWGGAWRTFKDGPHFQLPASRYPDEVKP